MVGVRPCVYRLIVPETTGEKTACADCLLKPFLLCAEAVGEHWTRIQILKKGSAN